MWSRDLQEEFQVPSGIFGVGHSPLIWNGLLILNVGGTTADSGIIAFDCLNGAIVWQTTAHGAAFATPRPARIHGRDWLFVLHREGLSLLNPLTGEEHWCLAFQPTIPDSANAVTPLVSGDVVMISAWGLGSKALQIDPAGGYSELWSSRRNLVSQYTPLLAIGGSVLGVHALDNSLRCVDLQSGDIRWRWKSELGNAKAISIGNRVVLFGEYGHLGLIMSNTERLVELCVAPEPLLGAGERCYSAPAYAAGRLYLRSESELLCLDLAGP